MGRPIKKSKFGAYAGTSAGIRVSAFIGGSNQNDVYIVKQVGSKRYQVEDASTSVIAICKLVEAAPAVAGEMQMLGYTNAGADISVALKKLTQRRAYDFAGNVYKWELVNDSSMDYIQLYTLV